jgi:hypothetical protein
MQTDGRAGGHTEVTQLIVDFCNVVNASKIMALSHGSITGITNYLIS